MDRHGRIILLLGIIAWLSPTTAATQLIPIRTVPVASGDQFRLLPSSRMPMGGVRYAVDDSISDPWANPALGTRLNSGLLLSSPTFYSISRQGGGRSFPVATLFSGQRWFGGGALALQQIENGDARDGPFITEPAIDLICCFPAQRTLSDRFGRNLYVSGLLGARLGGGPWSVGFGASAFDMQALDGVDLLYAGSTRIEQSGTITDMRLGVHREAVRDNLSLLLVHNRVSMKHDVSYEDWIWNSVGAPTVLPRRETHRDQTRTWSGHLDWDRALSAPGWKIGASATVNRKSHPKIPNYSIQNIPRDPGTTWAYEVGFGFSMSQAESVFAMDLAVQPIWSTTWQEANAEDVAASGGRIGLGDRSIENEFFFTNVILRSGVSHRIGIAGLGAGIEIRSYDYELEQVDRVADSFRDQRESWIEWSPTFGVDFRFSSLDLRYAGRFTSGTGSPGVASARFEGLASADQPDFILAPQGALTLWEARVVTHQVSVAIPIR